MGFLGNFKGQQALALHAKGREADAIRLYADALKAGMDKPRLLLAYSVLLIRDGQYEAAKDLLIKTQKAPGINAAQKSQLFMNYAVCMFKTGELDKGLNLLEKQHIHQPCGLIYETLGYLYVEKYQLTAKPEDAGEDWEAGVRKAQAFLKESVEYDDTDSICLDNMGQFCYRVLGDKAQAKEWFVKAHEEKENQIDTLWFLSRYDVEDGDTAAAIEKLEAAAAGRFSPLNYVTRDMVEAEIARLKA
ncbi:MAG: hypothetical protein IKK21_11450 [Clostridia bacterium]|nr:hypothetical protein [Clostridia bacterium]